MLDFDKCFREDRQLYGACSRILDLISLSRILDYVTVLSKEKGIVNKEFNDKLKAAIDGIEFANQIMVKYYTEPQKEDIKYQIYCIIKNGKCHICHIYEMMEWDEILDQKIDELRKDGSIVDTLAHIYCGELGEQIVKCSNGMEFDSIASAAQWCVSTGKSKATPERCATQIKKFINTDGTAYSLKWTYEKKEIERNWNYEFKSY